MSPTKSLRLLHLHTFYPEATEQLYRKNDALKQMPFETQMQAVLEDGVAGVHIFTPYLDGLGYVTQFIVADNPYAQSQWLRENEVTLDNPSDWVRAIARRQIDAFQPDVLYTCNPVLFDSAFIRSLKTPPPLVMGWRGADIDDGMDWSAFDVILSGLNGVLDAAPQLGARNADFFFPGFPERILTGKDVPPTRFDVVFSGSWTQRQHEARNDYLGAIAEAATAPGAGYSCAFHLAGDLSTVPAILKPHLAAPVFGVAMHQALRQGRIVFDARANHRFRSNGVDIEIGGEDTVNMRIFEALGSGCFLLTEHFEGLRRYFEPGVELETYRDRDELIQKIRYYLNHPDKRQAIAAKGQARCLREYNMPKRAEAFDRIIRIHLQNKKSMSMPSHSSSEPARPSGGSSQSTAVSREVERLLQTAIHTFKAGHFSEAFQAATKAKALRLPVLNIDYLRAACLLHLGKPIDAREALREELHYFPGNTNARQLLKEVVNAVPDTHRIQDPEFQDMLQRLRPHTMMPEARLYSLYRLAKQACVEDIPGNFVECGVARGGSTAMLGLIIARYSKRPRHHFGFDSFEGMPEPTVFDTQNGVAADDTGWGTGTCAGSLEEVDSVCRELGISDHVTLVKGYFEHTLEPARSDVGDIALLHLDADWYESTMTILNSFYDQVVPNGLLQFDDYGCWDGCRKAVEEYQLFHNTSFDLQTIPGDHQGMWMRKAGQKRTK